MDSFNEVFTKTPIVIDNVNNNKKVWYKKEL